MNLIDTSASLRLGALGADDLGQRLEQLNAIGASLSAERDLNPLLQDPGLVFHPPMLYMGYVGFSVAFAFAIAALLSGRLDAAWARWSRPCRWSAFATS